MSTDSVALGEFFKTPTDITVAKGFLKFNKNATSQFHCAFEATKLLDDAGYVKIDEKDAWDIQPNGKYYFTRNQSSVIAFAVGGQWKHGNGFVMAGAHTDSPCLKLKPISKVTSGECLQVGVQTYGGGLWHTWFDRDLSLSGRVIVRNTADNTYTSKLLCIKDPIMRIPNLAIHLNRSVNSDGFKINTETEMIPVISSLLADSAHHSSGVPSPDATFPGCDQTRTKCCASKPDVSSSTTHDKVSYTFQLKHHSPLLARIAHELNISASDIIDFELCLYDTQDPALNGLYNEYIVARGLDNQLMSYVCIQSLIATSNDTSILNQHTQVILTGLFNHEEIGSVSTTGADSSMLMTTLQRINNTTTLPQAIAKSIFISADMAHALHPNYVSKHQAQHQPIMHKGLVLKTNANQRYATDAYSTHAITLAAAEINVPIQDFVVRNDVGCGSTIGAMVSANTGCRVVDVGIPQWAMHSIRETAAVLDIESSYQLITHVMKNFPTIDQTLKLDF